MTERLQTVAMETYARRSYNYLANMVDEKGLPYFNIFWTDPAQAAHDWPDFGDVMSRQLQGAVMGRAMTGEAVSTEQTWQKLILSLIDPQTGLLTRPDTTYSKRVGDPGDNMLTLYALATAYADSQDSALKKATCSIVDGMLAMAEKEGVPGGFLGGFGIKSAMTCFRVTGYEPALNLARKMVDFIFYTSPLFSPDNTFRHGGHMHGNLRSLVGAADYALYTQDPVLFSRVDALYRYVRGEATSFGFLPEAIGRKGDIVSCETCAIMDYLGLAITLANAGHPEYWENIERTARNQLIESQVTDGSWLVSDPTMPDSDQFTWREIGQRMTGGYAGWTSPNHILAARETLNIHWGGAELHDKTRAFQNCCGGSGTHAFFEVWKNAARFENGSLVVNLHIDKRLPQAEIRGYQPFAGLLTIRLDETCKVKVRIPEFVQPGEMKVEVNGKALEGRVWGNYLELGEQPAGDTLRVSYPLNLTTEDVTIGNPGFRQYHYRATWKGATVVKMEPEGNDDETGYSDFDRKQVPIFYGKEGPGQLYLREQMMEDTPLGEVQLSPLHMDKGPLDFWYFGSRSQ
jgi:hypothetical protein